MTNLTGLDDRVGALETMLAVHLVDIKAEQLLILERLRQISKAMKAARRPARAPNLPSASADQLLLHCPDSAPQTVSWQAVRGRVARCFSFSPIGSAASDRFCSRS